MLGWVITCHDELAQEMLDRLEQKFGPLAQCRAVNYWRNLSSNMLSRMMCDALHATDSGDGVIFSLTKPVRRLIGRGADEPQTYPLRSDLRTP